MNSPRTNLRVAVAAACLSLLFGVALAHDGGKGGNHFSASLSGFSEVPAVVSSGRGKFKAWIDKKNQQIYWELSYKKTVGDILQAHIHLGKSKTNGGVIAFLCTNLGNAAAQPCPLPKGKISGTIFPADIIGPAAQGVSPGDFDSAVKAIKAGAAYINVHSSVFPGGELRGQVRDAKH